MLHFYNQVVSKSKYLSSRNQLNQIHPWKHMCAIQYIRSSYIRETTNSSVTISKFTIVMNKFQI